MASEKEMMYLCHHGVKGQKWGIRRYQNPDGSLTEQGKRRYGYYAEKGSAKYERGRQKAYDDTRKQYDKVSKSADKMRANAQRNPQYRHASEVMEVAKSIEKQAMNKTLSQLKMGKNERAYRKAGYEYTKYIRDGAWGRTMAGALVGPIGYAGVAAAQLSTPTARQLANELKTSRQAYITKRK